MAFQNPNSQTLRKGTKEPHFDVPFELGLLPKPNGRVNVKILEKKANQVFPKTLANIIVTVEVDTQYLPVPKWNAVRQEAHTTCTRTCLEGVAGKSLLNDPQYQVHSPFMKPLLFCWTRTSQMTGVVYTAPCGVKCRSIEEVLAYLQVRWFFVRQKCREACSSTAALGYADAGAYRRRSNHRYVHLREECCAATRCACWGGRENTPEGFLGRPREGSYPCRQRCQRRATSRCKPTLRRCRNSILVLR